MNKESETPSSNSPHILLRSAWQTVNIGDIGHTPGILSLIYQYVPGAKVTLWPNELDRGVSSRLKETFPELSILSPVSADRSSEQQREIDEAFDSCDFMLHGSGPHLVGVNELVEWSRETGKPYGVYGVTIDPLTSDLEDPERPTRGYSLQDQRKLIDTLPKNHLDSQHFKTLSEASFVYCRDSLTLDYLERQGIRCPILTMAPDAAFGIKLKDPTRAEAFLDKHDLEPGGYICVIPRLRYTPYHLTYNVAASERDLLRAEISDEFLERDMAKIRLCIIEWIRATGIKVLLCPEMTYQIQLAKDHIYDLLPEDVKERVVWRSEYWLPGEACSIYSRSRFLLSMDNHSPIFALADRIPTIFLRHPTDTIKGQMWIDYELGDWFMETDSVEAEKILSTMLSIHSDYDKALQKAEAFMQNIIERQKNSFGPLIDCLKVTRTS